jgi:hypothetical protein
MLGLHNLQACPQILSATKILWTIFCFGYVHLLSTLDSNGKQSVTVNGEDMELFHFAKFC